MAAGTLNLIAPENLSALDPVNIVSREGPSGSKNESKKNKKGKKNKQEERGFKTSSLQDSISSWQYKFRDAQESAGNLDKQERFFYQIYSKKFYDFLKVA